MTRDYSVRIEYVRPSGTPATVTYIINAKSATKARNEGRARLANDPRRKYTTITKSYAVTAPGTPGYATASVGGPERPSLQQVPKNKVVRAGDRITLDIPYTGTVEHTKDGKVTIVGDLVYPNGQRAKRTLPREYFEQLTGLELEPAPRKTFTSYYSIYPNDGFYKQDFGPVKNSSYPLDRLVQLKVVRYEDDGSIVSKEFV